MFPTILYKNSHELIKSNNYFNYLKMCNILDVSSLLSAWPLNLLEYNAYVP